MMTYFEQELRKIVGGEHPDATFVGRACYVRLNDMTRAKSQFIACGVSSHYDALRLTILNRTEGDVDNLVLHFKDILGSKQVGNPNFRNGISPYIWDDGGKMEWYVYHPNARDFQKLSDAVSDYLEVFQEQAQTADPQWQQTM